MVVRHLLLLFARLENIDFVVHYCIEMLIVLSFKMFYYLTCRTCITQQILPLWKFRGRNQTYFLTQPNYNITLHNCSFQVFCLCMWHLLGSKSKRTCNQFTFKMYKAKGEFFTQALLFDSLRFPPVVWWINSTVLHWQLLSRRPESCREKHFSKLDSDGFFALLRSLSYYVIKAIVAIYMYLEKNIWCLLYSLRMKYCIWILDRKQFGPFSYK